MKPWLFMTVAGLTLAAASPASSRIVDYSLDKAAIEAAAQDQGIQGPFSDPPDTASLPFTVEDATAADHGVKVVSIYCQAYKVENPVSALLQRLLPPPPAAAPPATLRLIKGSTLLRCLGTGEFKSICKNEVRISAELRLKLADGTVVTRPVLADVEREGRVGGFCGNMARYTAIVGREAGIELLGKALAAYREMTLTAP